MNNKELENKGFSKDTTKNPLKKAHFISDKVIVVIDESLVQSLEINSQHTWFEEEKAEYGIFLRIHRYPFPEED